MEDDLDFFENGRRPRFFENGRRPMSGPTIDPILVKNCFKITQFKSAFKIVFISYF